LETLTEFARGHATAQDMANLEVLAARVCGITFCPMGTGMAAPIGALLHHFRPEFEARVRVAA
jgi:NADH-quinone oxidoreductase subunit F